MSLTMFIECLQNQIFLAIVLSILVIIYTSIYFWNYFRICYYAFKFPGPTAYPIFGNLLMVLGSCEEKAKKLKIIGEQYQNLFIRLWVGPLPLFVTSDPEIVQKLLTNPNALEKPYLQKIIWNGVMGESIVTFEVSKWKNHRSIMIRGFTPTILKSFFKIFVEKINILTQKLDLEKETSFDIFKYLSRTALDSVCGSTMGVNINSYDESSYFDAIHIGTSLAFTRVLNILKIPTIFYKLTEDYKIISKARDILQEFGKNIISEKRKKYVSSVNNNVNVREMNKNKYKKPLLEYLMDFTKYNSDFTDEQLRNEANFVIMAAFDTTASALSFLLLELASNKDIQNKVYHEISEVLGKRDSIEHDDLPKLKYMEMVIKESMRLHPSIPIIGREVTTDIKIGNNTIPKGATVVMPIFIVHRNNKYWKNPLKFDPDRFTPENIKNRHPYAYIPFSAGPRNCIGIQYAWILMKATLATLLSRYEFHTDLNLEELRYDLQVTLKLVNGCQVRITPR